jgi:hypothetical protein
MKSLVIGAFGGLRDAQLTAPHDSSPLVAVCRVIAVNAGFYESISSRDSRMFAAVLWRAALIVVLVATLKARGDVAPPAAR